LNSRAGLPYQSALLYPKPALVSFSFSQPAALVCWWQWVASIT
jgi:hypothetical protein